MFISQGRIRPSYGGKMKKKRIIFLIIFLHIIGIGIFKKVFPGKSRAKVGAGSEPAPTVSGEKTAVKVEKVKREDLERVFSYAGSLKAKNEALVYSKVSGKLLEYLVSEGDTIKKGQVVALVDRDETGLKYEPAKVESPIEGIVGRVFLDKGADVLGRGQGVSGGAPLALIVDMEEMLVRLSLPEADVPYIRKGLKARLKVDAYANEELSGEVYKVSEVLDPVSRSLPIEIIIPNPEHKLKSGMFARIAIFAEKHPEVLTIAQDALVKEDSSEYVYVVSGSTARKRQVKSGIYQDSRIEISEGLKEAETVIVFGHQGLRDGSLVNVIE